MRKPQIALDPPLHGGDLGSARRLFPDAPLSFVDLSTGINPHAYPVLVLPEESLTRLPEQDALHDADLAIVVNPNNPDGRLLP